MASRIFHRALAFSAGAALLAATPEWVTRSNQNTQVLVNELARESPEAASQFGVEGLDDQIMDLKPGFVERSIAGTQKVETELEKRRAAEKDAKVSQDLDILIKSAKDNLRSTELDEKYRVPYFDMNMMIYMGLRTLLDDQVAADRRQAAVARLKKYAGVTAGYTPITVLAEQYTRSEEKPGRLWPIKAEVNKNLENAQFFVNDIGRLFAKYKLTGYEEAYAKLKEQLAEYNGFVKTEILPHAREDFRLPPELYAFQLNQVGIDIPPAELAAKAHAAFTEIQAQMQVIAGKLAKENGWSFTDYRDVIRQLKKDQLVGTAIVPHYEKRLGQIEDIIRREHLVTLPDRPARIRLASEAETAQTPAPNMKPPRLIGNQGEKGEFVLPLNVPSEGKLEKSDDFTFDAASWTLTAHEARPGHELQFDEMVETGVPVARALFAFNSTNVEGWGLYSEYIMFPYMPPAGQLISLQHRLMRAARAFLDPELQMGKITPEQARRVLHDDVVLSNAMTTEEVERYTFRSPGQACAYFYGYTRLLELRKDTEKQLGARFNQQRYHDFILAQGLLPPQLMRKAVMEEFIPSQMKGGSAPTALP